MTSSEHAFLFTDLAESTRLWERHPEAMGPALARHDEILRLAVETAGGTVVKTTGDGLMAVFASPDQGLTAALAAQRALAAEDWGETGPLRVRMGIHVGDAEPRAGDYYGTAVNRAARIMASAHGGQVLVSALVTARVRERLPDEAGLTDLGEHRLRDLSEPERLYQITHPDLPDGFPPPLTLTGRPNNLPTQASEFLGREDELEGLHAAFAEGARLVTLTGPGGTGKTRLGLQAAANLIDRFPDGVFFVDLSNEEGRDSVLEAIQRSLGAPGGDEGPLAAILTHLRGRSVLLLIDNFEHVADAAPDLARLLGGAEGLRLLVTSREALRVRGERLFPVNPLGLPTNGAVDQVAAAEAVRLFLDRARAVRPDFTLTERNAAAVAEICVRLDGLPLALELAAARLTLFSPEELRDRLRDRLDVLGVGARDLPARQRTIRSAIEWSVELLDAEETLVFAALSVFATARLESVEEVARQVGNLADLDMIGPLFSLVDKSLVRSAPFDGHQRLSMLRTIRDYGAERLAAMPELEAALRAAHAEHYMTHAVNLSRSVFGSEREATLATIEAELGNLALAWAFWREAGDRERLRHLLDCLWPFHDARGSYAATIGLTTDLLELVTAEEPTPERLREEVVLRASLARALVTVHGSTRRVQEAVAQAMELFTEAGEGAERFAVLRNLATLFGTRADFGRAREIGLELLRLADEADEDALRCEAHFVTGAYTAFTGSIDEGLDHLDRAADLFDPDVHAATGFRIGPISGVLVFTARAFLLWWTGRPVRALQSRDDALRMAKRVGHPYTLAYVLYHVAFFDLGRRDLARVSEVASELMEVSTAHDYEVWKALAMLLEGVVAAGTGRAEEGLARIEQAMTSYETLDTPPVFWGFLQATRAAACAMAGRPDLGLPLVEESIAVSGPGTPDFAAASTLKGDLLWAMGDTDGAEACFASAVAAAAGAGTVMIEMEAAVRLTSLRRSLGRTPDGSDDLRRALAGFDEGLDLPELVHARSLLEPA
jgi:predicted ATPase/class 3 adenylate cyclase